MRSCAIALRSRSFPANGHDAFFATHVTHTCEGPCASGSEMFREVIEVKRTIVMIALSLISTGLVCAETLTLAEGGAPAMTIVRPDADEAAVAAADKLQAHIVKLVGVELPVASDAAAPDGPVIFVGECAQTAEADLPPENAGPEAYAVRVRDGNLILTGRKPWAVEFAVYSFLEDELGIRWFVPGPLGEHIPAHEQGELIVDVTPRVVAPDFSPRVWSGNHFAPSWKQWNRYNKLSLSNDLPWRQFQNNIYRVFPPSKYAEDHPEYYPLINGERWIPPDDSARYWRPCESNPEVLRLTAEYAHQWFADHPDANGFSVGMDDVSHMCQCENCIALDPDPEAYKRREYSDRHYWFVNALARELAKSDPDKYVGTLIYSIARKPPTTIDKLEPNVFGFITQNESEWWREGVQAEDEALTREWRRRCQHLCRYTYWGLGWTTPRYYPHFMADALKFDHDLGFHGEYVEVYTNWPNTGPMIWAGSKLFWDASLDIDELLAEFMNGMFAEAAPEMAAYYDHLEQTWVGGNANRTGWGHRRLPTQVYSMTVAQLDEAERLLAIAAAKAATPIVKDRIAMIERGLRTGSYIIRTGAMSDALGEMNITNAADAQAMLDLILDTQRLVAERREYYAQLRETDDLPGQTLRELDWYFKGQVPAVALESGLAVGMSRALAWFEAHAPERVAEVSAAMRASAPADVLGLLDGWTYVAENDVPNLLKNPSFEEAGENQEEAEKDWSTAGAPPGWSTWARDAAATRFESVGEATDGDRAASISGASSACYLQTVDVKPGERYLGRFSAMRVPTEGKSEVQMSVRWRTPEGSWLKDRSSERASALPRQAAKWQPLFLFVTAPEEAGKLTFMCSASGQDEETSARFDDCAVYLIPAR